jgi:histidinol-phosphatase
MDADEELLAAAVEIVAAPSRLAAQRFLEGAPATIKADGSEVTAADVEVEELFRSLITERFPGDGVVGEEQGEAAGSSGRRWVIDPINGTSSFTRRIPSWNIFLAVEDEAGSAVSVISYPMTREVYYAGRGLGSWHQIEGGQPERISVSNIRNVRGAVVEMVNPATWSEQLLVTLHREVLLIPDLRGLSGLASGHNDALVIAGLPMGYEDVAPMPLLVTEAGGRVTDLNGQDVLHGDGTVLATNGHLHDALLELVRTIPHGRDYKALLDARA